MESQTGTVEMETRFVEGVPFTTGYEQEICEDVGLPFYVDVHEPEGTPTNQEAKDIDLAERILKAGEVRTDCGHHDEVRQSMEYWAPARGENRDADPGYWRRMVYTITPSERNLGSLEGDDQEQLRKAKTVIAWAEDVIDEDVLVEIEREQIADIKTDWKTEAESVARERKFSQFVDDPPEKLNGWERFDADHVAVELAYRANNNGVPSIGAVFQNENGELDAIEFTVEEWEDAQGNPREARPNRIMVNSDADDAYGILYGHLHTFDGEELETA